MSTQPKTSKDVSYPAHEDFVKYPLYKVVSIFEKPEHVDAAISELHTNGFTIDDIDAFCGMAGEEKMDFDGSREGVWTQFVKGIQHVGPERTYLERFEKHLAEGHCMIMVAVKNKERKETAGRVLNNHTNQQVTYFGLLAANEIKADEERVVDDKW